jgi:bacterioferritin-associated ferredoxin
MDQVICYCKYVTKAEIDNAIQSGAKTLKDLQEMTSACNSNLCKELNPSGECCSGDINTLLYENNSKAGHSCCCCK